MAHSPAAFRRFYELLVVLWYGSVTPRLREVAILGVVAASDAPYPLGWHVIDAAEAGLSDDEVWALVRGDLDALPPRDTATARYARALAADARVDDATFAAVAESLDERQVVELTLLVGMYRLVAPAANALEVELEDEPTRRLHALTEG
jgi:alkylhydroperoxidase family enzyme